MMKAQSSEGERMNGELKKAVEQLKADLRADVDIYKANLDAETKVTTEAMKR